MKSCPCKALSNSDTASKDGIKITAEVQGLKPRVLTVRSNSKATGSSFVCRTTRKRGQDRRGRFGSHTRLIRNHIPGKTLSGAAGIWIDSALDLLTHSQVRVQTFEKENLTDATKGAQEDSEKVENFMENHLDKILWDCWAGMA